MQVVIVVCVEPTGPSASTQAALAAAAALGPVTAVSAGPNPSLGRWAVRAVQLIDTAIEGADPLTLGAVLAQAASHLGGKLVLAGSASGHEGRGLVPAAIAHHMKAVYLARVEEVALVDETLVATVRAGGRRRRMQLPLPAVLTFAPLPSTTPQQSATVETLSLAQIGLDPATLVRRSDALGALVEGRARRPVAVKSVPEIVKRWTQAE